MRENIERYQKAKEVVDKAIEGKELGFMRISMPMCEALTKIEKRTFDAVDSDYNQIERWLI